MSDQNNNAEEQPKTHYPEPMLLEPPNGSLIAGMALTMPLHFLQIPIFFILAAISVYFALAGIIFVGVSQLIYMIPAVLIAFRNGRKETSEGIDHRGFAHVSAECGVQRASVRRDFILASSELASAIVSRRPVTEIMTQARRFQVLHGFDTLRH